MTLPPDFVADEVTPGQYFQTPTAFCFTPSGRIFVCEQRGRVWAVTNGVRDPAPMIDLSAEVLQNGTRGLLAIAVDPHFVENRWVYLFYTVDPDSDGRDDEDDAFSRLTRYQVSATDSAVIDPTTRQVLLGATWETGWPDGGDSHSECALRFGRDGTLLVGHGDGGQADVVDAGGWDPGLFTPGRCDPAEDVGAYRARDLASLDGKILRLDPETGRGVPGNPFWDGDPGSNRSRIWALGLRNPYRFAVRPGTGSVDPADARPGTLVIGDVGWSTWEELDVAASGGLDFGWPCEEGPAPNALYRDGAEPAHSGCVATDPAGAPVPPIAWWNHDEPDLAHPATSPEAGVCVIGGAFADAARYPAPWRGAYFFGDFVRSWIKAATFDAGDHLTRVDDFATDAGGPVDFATDPVSGDLFYLSINTGELRRVRYTGAVTALTVRASARVLAGPAPLATTFAVVTGSGADDAPLALQWSFGDGTGSTVANPSHVYFQPGTYDVLLLADDGAGGTARDSLRVIVTADSLFPTAAVLDTFARADGPLEDPWTAGAAAYEVRDAAVPPLVGDSLALWADAFGPDQEAFLEVRDLTPQASPGLLFDCRDEVGAQARVEVRWDGTSGSVVVATVTPDSGAIERGRIAGCSPEPLTRFGASVYSNGAVVIHWNGATRGTISLGAGTALAAGGRIGFVFPGTGPARLRAFGGGDAERVAGAPPVVDILSPADSSFFITGDPLVLRGDAHSRLFPDDHLRFAWKVDVVEPFRMVRAPLLFAARPETAATAPDTEDSTHTYLRVRLAVTAPDGRVSFRVVRVFPEVDLAVGPVHVRPDTVDTEAPAEFAFTVTNRGRMGAPRTRWRLVLGDSLVAQGLVVVPALDSARIVVRASVRSPSGGRELSLFVDPNRRLVETDETNNRAERTLVVAPGRVPDVLEPLFRIAPWATRSGDVAWVRWSTDEPSTGVVRWGASAPATDSLREAAPALDHFVRIEHAALARFLDVVARDTAGNSAKCALDSLPDEVVEPPPPVPAGFALSAAHPNPARTRVAFTLELSEPADVALDVFDPSGRRVGGAPVRRLGAGSQTVEWSAASAPRGVPPGLYLARIRAGALERVRRFVIVH